MELTANVGVGGAYLGKRPRGMFGASPTRPSFTLALVLLYFSEVAKDTLRLKTI